MTRILVIGFGNTLRNDDGAGYKVAELISKNFLNITTVTSHDLKPEYAELIAHHQVVFFIDASIDCNELVIEEITTIPNSEIQNSHHLNPIQLISLSKKLFRQVPKNIFIVKLPAINLDFGEKLSQPTQKAMESFLNWFEKFQKSFIS